MDYPISLSNRRESMKSTWWRYKKLGRNLLLASCLLGGKRKHNMYRSIAVHRMLHFVLYRDMCGGGLEIGWCGWYCDLERKESREKVW